MARINSYCTCICNWCKTLVTACADFRLKLLQMADKGHLFVIVSFCFSLFCLFSENSHLFQFQRQQVNQRATPSSSSLNMTSITFLPSIGNLPNKTTAQQSVNTALQAIDGLRYKAQVALQAQDILTASLRYKLQTACLLIKQVKSNSSQCIVWILTHELFSVNIYF